MADRVAGAEKADRAAGAEIADRAAGKAETADRTAGAEKADRAAGAEKADRATGTWAEKGAQRTDGLPRGAGKRRRRAVYRKDLPKQIYLYFLRAAEAGEIPSLHKFAVLSGMTTEELTGFRRRAEFDRAVRECEAIRKDLLIDAALGKKVDGTFAKFLLAAEFGMGEKDEGSDRELAVTLEVVR